MENLERDFTRLVERTNDRVLSTKSRRVYNRLLQLTPVDTGFLRSNWHVLPGQNTATVLIFGNRERLIIDNTYKFFLPAQEIPVGSSVSIINNTRYGPAVQLRTNFVNFAVRSA